MKNIRSIPTLLLRLLAVVLCGVALVGGFPARTQAQVYEKVFSFTDARTVELAEAANSGSIPAAALVQGSDGNFYGTTATTGASGSGTVFKMTPAGGLTTLVEFTGTEPANMGSRPNRLVQGSDGNFYGTTSDGGASDNGTVFQVTVAGVLTTLVEFTGNGTSNKGSHPFAGLLLGSDGNFYGTTSLGGANDCGTIFKMTPAGVLTTLVEFTGPGGSNKGSSPYGGLVLGNNGNFYGTTFRGGANNQGTMFKMTPGGVLTTLVEFTGNGTSNKGSEPWAGLVKRSDGNFYGTTSRGGANNYGTVFKMTPAGVLTTLVEFTDDGTSSKGIYPFAGLVQGSDGNFYGATGGGGANSFGTIFKIATDGTLAGTTLTTLVEFTGNGTSNKGSAPQAGLVQGSDGNFYGTTPSGGAFGGGTVFKMTTAGILTTLWEFRDNTGGSATKTGRNPYAGLVQGSDGNFFGTTFSGGAFGNGTIFKMTPTGVLTTLVAFLGDGNFPFAGLVQGSDGTFYGTTHGTPYSTNNYGTVFQMTPAGVLTNLVVFTGNGTSNKGRFPYAGLVEGSDGNFYGTTRQGGASDYGTVFKMTSTGVLTTLVEFTGNGTTNKGRYPDAGLVLGSDGNFYGTTELGGGNGSGTVFKMTPDGLLTTLVKFTGNGINNKGSSPYAALVLGTDGNFYGTTSRGGANDQGTVFKMTAGGVLTTLVEFTGNGTTNKGSSPKAGLVLGSDGNFYGTTSRGGAKDQGTIFQMTPNGVLKTLFDFAGDPVDYGPEAPLSRGFDGNFYGTVVGGSGGAGSIYRLVFSGAPNVFLLDPDGQTSTSAIIAAKVNARGATTTVSLEYGDDGVAFPNTVPVKFNLTGYQTTLLGTTLSNLSPGTTYFYRFRAVSSAGTTLSPVQTFSTLAEPVATATAASAILKTSATLNGTVNARNYDSTVTFEYGTDGSTFPNSVPAVPGTVTGSKAKAVSKPVAGLTEDETYYYRVVATNVAGTTVSGTSTFKTLTDPTAKVGAAIALSSISAKVDGSVNAHGSNVTVTFEYGTDGTHFPKSVEATPTTVTGNTYKEVSAELTGLTPGTTYYYRVKAENPGLGLLGRSPSPNGSFKLEFLSGFSRNVPGASREAHGVLQVNLSKNPIEKSPLAPAWRLVGEQRWRPSGGVATGLPTGEWEIEYRPIPGYHAPASERVPVNGETAKGSTFTSISWDYTDDDSSTSGALNVILTPSSLGGAVAQELRAQWRFFGDGDPGDLDDNISATWRDSDTTVSPLPAGTYVIEFKPVSGYASDYITPALKSASVATGPATSVTANYVLETQSDPPPALPAPLSLPDALTGDPTPPYAYVGQLRTRFGTNPDYEMSTGFVVSKHVVATVGHALFDGAKFAPATEVQWLFQRNLGTYEPAPQLPRGYYLLAGYAAQRKKDIAAGWQEGESSAASKNLDTAALYFLNDNLPGRGGFGGYLASESTLNEYLLSPALKTLVGYPVDGPIPTANQGRMHATAPMNVKFAHAGFAGQSPYRTYTTDDLKSFGGNSGGPLCVQFTDPNDNVAKYYPAAIYLGGTGQTVVRAIDGLVTDLFSRAEVSASAGNDNTNQGSIQVSSVSSGTLSPGTLKIVIQPAGIGGKWSFRPLLTSASSSSAVLDTLGDGASKTVYFTRVPGFDTPPSQEVTIVHARDKTVTGTYKAISANADLINLAPNTGTLTPDFARTNTSYTAGVPNGTASMTLTPTTVADSGAQVQVRVNGGPYAAVASGSASVALALNVGINTLDVRVTAASIIKVYTVTVTRNPSFPEKVAGAWSERTLLRNLPTAGGRVVDIGTVTFIGGTGSIEAAVNATGSGWSVAKRYVIPIRNNLGTGSPPGTWLKVLPTHDTGPYGVNDFDLDINGTGATALLRLRTVGSNGNAATARIAIKTIGLQTFVNSAATAAAAVPLQTLAGNAVDELMGQAGIGVAPSESAVIDVNGGDTRGLRLRLRSTPGAPTTGRWNKGTMILDSAADLFICTAPGTPGTWKKVGAP